MIDQVKRILDFLALSERLKFELRHSWLSSGRQESVAEHSWQMALMAMLMHRHLEQPVDIEKTLKMVLVHDLVEAEVGDVPFFETGERKQLKAAREQMAIEKIRRALDPGTGQEIYDLWQEYEAKATAEARFATALDHLEVQVQHNLADFATWEPTEYDLVYTKMDGPCAADPFLAAFCAAVKEQAEGKMQRGGIDPAAVRRRLGAAAGP
ncbi:MAG TPA: HD domain-containing protein [Candidatus Angelobacter sp.]|nr:HD domain-containing protein [Candidatus Angelobacter sp.]